jgi:hypothetical protein
MLYAVLRDRPTFLFSQSLGERKNAALAINASALFKQGLKKAGHHVPLRNSRLVIGGGYDPS